VKRLKYYVLIGLGLFILMIYLYTVAPTVSFWDCGEFIATAYIMGVPHPPGTPFFVIFGRFWILLWQAIASIFPITKEVAFYMNLTSALSGVATSLLVYIIVLKILRLKGRNDSLFGIVAAAGAALINAFAKTFWFNSMETEVYTISTFFAITIVWLTLHWYEEMLKGRRKDYLILFIFYLMFLATGIHLLPFLLILPVYLFIFYVRPDLRRDISFWSLGIFQILLFFALFISPDPLFKPSLYAAALLVVGTIFYNFSDPRLKPSQTFFILGVVLILIAVSTEYFLFLRSHSPNIRINECCPSTWQAFWDVLHRKQYEPFGLIPRKTQLQTGYSLLRGYFEQIRLYLKYFSWQFTLIPSLIGIWGFFEYYERDRRTFLFLFIIFFMTSIALMTYLNLKFSPYDPNPFHQPREVRDRDYFFAPGFTFFTIFFGIGVFGLLGKLTQILRDHIPIKTLVPVLTTVTIIISLLPLKFNFAENNRHHRWVAKDYGNNMLISCDDNSVLFTNGDNDTFPLWFAQEVLGTKRSVIVANLSLINTSWYIKQLKAWGAPITFSDWQIDRLRPVYLVDQKKFLYVKDIMIRHIIATNAGITLSQEDYAIPQEEFARRYLKGYKGRMNIYFATTVSEENFAGFRPYLRLEGLVYRLVGDSGVEQIDVERTIDLFYKKYRYTGIFFPEDFDFLRKVLPDFETRKKNGEFPDYHVHRTKDIIRLLSNYAAGMAALGHYYLSRAESLEALNDESLKPAIDSCYQKVEEFWNFGYLFRPEEAYRFLANLGVMKTRQKDYGAALRYFLQLEKLKPEEPRFLLQIGEVYSILGAKEKAEEYFRRALRLNPKSPDAYNAMIRHYLYHGDTLGLKMVMNEWLRYHPSDTKAQQFLRMLLRPK